MKKITLTLILSALAIASPSYSLAGVNEDAMQGVIAKYYPPYSGFAKPKVEKVSINQKNKTITIECNESTSYIPLSLAQVDAIKEECKNSLPSKYGDYDIKITSNGFTLENLASDASHKVVAPTEKDKFITRLDRTKAPLGLDGANIGLWQSHGLYYSQGTQEWEWQRARLFETVEDLFTQSFVMPYLMPMLENAGAYVMSPRERDTQLAEYIIDNDFGNNSYSEKNGEKKWSQTTDKGFGYNGDFLTEAENPFQEGTARVIEVVQNANKESKATWNADIEKAGDYAVYVSYKSLPNSATDAVYTINSASGPQRFQVNQQMGGGTWIYLGHFPLNSGKSELPIVELSNVSKDNGAVITADAVKIGGGYGNVARRPLGSDIDYAESGVPRFIEGARYWLQWAGAPEDVYNESEGKNDYTDDFRSRGLWINWLTGGSSILPNEPGLKIPIDLSFAFHSDAGVTKNDTIIGTLGIYCTDSQELYPNGTSRLSARDLTNFVMTNITSDIRSTFEPDWKRRGMWDKNYAEARRPQVPAMLLELLSHQNFADMRYGLDPEFKFTVSRAIYKGMLQFLAQREGREYVVQPLPVNSFAIQGGDDGLYSLSWEPTEDKLESSANPTFYIVQERKAGNAGFTQIAIVEEPWLDIEILDRDIYSYRVIAGNDGGLSFPSETLSLCYMPDAPQVMIVNGFTRISAPEWFDDGSHAGFCSEKDNGVPYMKDISFIGHQFEFRRNIPWMDNGTSGLGASHSDYEGKVIAGNNFDYPFVHGKAIADAGWGFVSMGVDAFIDCDSLQRYAAVDLILGKQKEIQKGTGKYGTKFKTFPSQLQDKIKSYLNEGGNIFVSGSFIATDLWDNPYSSSEVAERDKKFATEILGYKWILGQASRSGELKEKKNRARGFDGGDFEFCNDLNGELYAVQSPDAIAPASKSAAAVMLYKENKLTAATAFNAGQYRSVAMGVPFETIMGDDSRSKLMKQILTFLYQNK